MALFGPSRTELEERKRERIYFFVREGAAATEPNITLERDEAIPFDQAVAEIEKQR